MPLFMFLLPFLEIKSTAMRKEDEGGVGSEAMMEWISINFSQQAFFFWYE